MSKPNFSMTALQTFSVVTKELNFSKAAEVLNISPSAVSHQMKLLESQLGVSLFHRKSKGVMLTDTAEQLAEKVNKGFELIDFGIGAAQQTDSIQRIVLAVVPSLLEHWLIPRLNDFYDAFGHVDLHLIAADQLVDFNQRHIHGHLHFGHGQQAELTSVFMAHEYVYPVCSPSYEKTLLESECLLSYAGGAEDAPSNMSWATWFKHQSLVLPKQPRYRRFSHVGHTLNAAKHGQGIALCWHHIASAQLADGALLRLPFTAIQLPFSYHLMMPKDIATRPIMQQITRWLASQFARSHGMESDIN
ncbi:LysR substrate-binding domain-containing protein [Pseudoalteromonas sp. SMS1]|uniref:LysR family transcriptional regulator n=1 Tax=Pseudoalteromonas sp. SMS1 TaxID=2908894 RepID=UPI001F3B9D00|nr:LysR family transcriptional regulator [Pseudoalteromonas sp. SMS1]MCF2857660.1 LysR substrate-binding domain-containing protein [Pseudoalteromonas sp. SMS1]